MEGTHKGIPYKIERVTIYLEMKPAYYVNSYFKTSREYSLSEAVQISEHVNHSGKVEGITDDWEHCLGIKSGVALDLEQVSIVHREGRNHLDEKAVQWMSPEWEVDEEEIILKLESAMNSFQEHEQQ